MPSLYDIKGSSAWKEKADIGIVVHRYKNKKRDSAEIPKGADEDDKYEVMHDAPTIIRTEKIRFEETGVEDRVKLRMDAKRGGRFFLYDEKDKPEPVVDVKKLNPGPEKVFGDDEDENDGLPF
jgi:hypothetical protein